MTMRAAIRSTTFFVTGLLAIEGSARCETETTTLDISAIVPATCTVGQMSVDLGAIALNRKEEILARRALDISCPTDVPYRLSVDEGDPAFLVSATGGARIPYSIAIVDAGADDASVQPLKMVEIRATLTGDEPAGQYRQEVRLRLDW